MKKLAEKKYWDSIYENNQSSDKNNRSSLVSNIKTWLKSNTRDYSNFVMWEIIIPKFLPKSQGLKIIEVGCAPGKYLINFNKVFGYEPYGVEYSESGASITRTNFKVNNLNPDNIISADFFDPKFEEQYNGKFDLVFSRGFIEHYDDVVKVVDKHIDLVESGGLIIISIPNLSGVNKILGKLFNIDSYNLHNISIMNKEDFGGLFSKEKVEHLYCDYVGIFSFGLFNTNTKWKYYIHRVLLVLQRPVDLLLRLLFKNGRIKYKNSSPYLLFIGKKR